MDKDQGWIRPGIVIKAKAHRALSNYALVNEECRRIWRKATGPCVYFSLTMTPTTKK